jgi:hypothetical protein
MPIITPSGHDSASEFIDQTIFRLDIERRAASAMAIA